MEDCPRRENNIMKNKTIIMKNSCEQKLLFTVIREVNAKIRSDVESYFEGKTTFESPFAFS